MPTTSPSATESCAFGPLCVFRSHLGADSGGTWALIPARPGQGFRSTWAPIPGHLGAHSGAPGHRFRRARAPESAAVDGMVVTRPPRSSSKRVVPRPTTAPPFDYAGILDESPAFRIGFSNRERVIVRPSRRERPEADDYSDGNWVEATIDIAAGAFRGEYEAQLRAEEFVRFRDQVRRLCENLGGCARFPTAAEAWAPSSCSSANHKSSLSASSWR
jgi:hypothetical protein